MMINDEERGRFLILSMIIMESSDHCSHMMTMMMIIICIRIIAVDGRKRGEKMEEYKKYD